MIGPVAGQDLEAPGVAACQLDGILVGVRAAKGEQDLGQGAARRDLGHQPTGQRPHPGRHARGGIGQLRGLLLHGFDDARVAVAGIDTHGHRIEIQVALAGRIPEIDALGACDRDRVHAGLRRPGPEDVLLRKRQDLIVRKIEHAQLTPWNP